MFLFFLFLFFFFFGNRFLPSSCFVCEATACKIHTSFIICSFDPQQVPSREKRLPTLIIFPSFIYFSPYTYLVGTLELVGDNKNGLKNQFYRFEVFFLFVVSSVILVFCGLCLKTHARHPSLASLGDYRNLVNSTGQVNR